MARDKPKSGLERQIEENLKKVYQKTVEEDVPDRFTDLLKQLKEQDESK
ncbi:MAG: NepR family anti-sigma factor [Paracoccaceae bacterium]